MLRSFTTEYLPKAWNLDLPIVKMRGNTDIPVMNFKLGDNELVPCSIINRLDRGLLQCAVL